MRHESNVIELSAYRAPSGLERELPSQEAKRRGEAWCSRVLTAVELGVTCAIGVGFTACVLSVFHNAVSAAVSGRSSGTTEPSSRRRYCAAGS